MSTWVVELRIEVLKRYALCF